MYVPPSAAMLPPTVDDDYGLEQNEKENQEHLEEFYEDIYYELRNYGKVEELNVCDNVGRRLSALILTLWHSRDLMAMQPIL